ncbi:gliding motility-associated protein GldE [Porphyromonas endodontalis]
MDSLFSDIIVYPFGWQAAITLGIILLLIVLSGYMSSSEVSFFSLSPQDIHLIRESKTPHDQKLLALLENSEKLLATILIGNNIVNIGIVLSSNYLVHLLFDFGINSVLSFVLQTIVLTFVLLLFCEIIPKVYAQQHPLSFSRFSAHIMQPLVKVLSPFTIPLVKTSSILERRGKKHYELSVDDLSRAVELTEGKNETQSKLIGEIIKFHDKTADEIMVPRVDMVMIDYQWDFASTLRFVLDAGYSRIPVFLGTQDVIKGILYIKDCLPYTTAGADFDWHTLIRPANFVPENKKIDDLLEEFRSEHRHISIVVDEYGGTSGLITLEDILEEIVGEITDEYDEDELPYTRLADGSFLFEGKTQINDFCRYLSLEDSLFDPLTQEIDTLGGIFLELKQELPRVGAFVTYRGYRFEITKVEKHRIMQMRVIPPATASAS